jgi:hypothetical protein
MKKITTLLLALLTSLMITTSANAEFFRDVIVTSPNAIWTDSRTYASINDAIAAVGSDKRTIVIVNKQDTTNLTIPSNVTLKFERDGSISNSGQLTINTRNIIAESKQIFIGTGDIDFIDGSVIKTSWFPSLHKAITLTNDDSVTLLVDNQAHITTSCALGNNVILKWDSSNNIIQVDAGVEFSNIKNIEAGNYQIFAGTGDYDFLDGTILKCDWFSSLRAANSYIESEEVTLVISKSTSIDFDTTTTENINYRILKGGYLDVDAGVTLTINGTVEAGPYQIITGDGTISISTYPQEDAWWGLDQFLRANGLIDSLIIYNPDYNEADQGITGGGETVKAYVDTIGTNSGTIIFRHNSGLATTTYTFSTDETIPSNIRVVIEKGAVLSIATSKTLTINGPFSAGLYQVFSGDGTVSWGGGNVKEVYPEWWGAVGDFVPATGVGTNNRAPIVSAITSILNGGTLKFAPGSKYKITGTLGAEAFNVSIPIVGATNLDIDGTGAYIYEGAQNTYGIFNIRESDGVKIHGFRAYGYACDTPNNMSQHDYFVTVSTLSFNVSIYDNYITNFAGGAVGVRGSFVSGDANETSENVRIYNNTIKERYGSGTRTPEGMGTRTQNGIAIIDADGVSVTNNTIYGRIDIEPNSTEDPANQYPRIRHIVVDNNVFKSGFVTPINPVGTDYWGDETLNNDESGNTVIDQQINVGGAATWTAPGYADYITPIQIRNNSFEHGLITVVEQPYRIIVQNNYFKYGRMELGSTNTALPSNDLLISGNYAANIFSGETEFIYLNGLIYNSIFENNSCNIASGYCIAFKASPAGDGGRNFFCSNKNTSSTASGAISGTPNRDSYYANNVYNLHSVLADVELTSAEHEISFADVIKPGGTNNVVSINLTGEGYALRSFKYFPDGTIIHILCGLSGVDTLTITYDSLSIRLTGATDYVMGGSDTLSLIMKSNIAWELSRSVN